VSAIVDGRFLRSDNGKRTVTRRPDGGLDHVMTLAQKASFSSILPSEEARALDLPGTRLTWRFFKDDGRSDWTLVLVDGRDAMVWVHRKGHFPDGYRPVDPAPVDAEPVQEREFSEAWMDEGLGMEGVYCVTLVQDVTPDEALKRFGAPEDAIFTATWPELLERANFEEADVEDHVVAAFPLGRHTLLVEDNGWQGVHRPDLSAGTFAVSSFRNINADTGFVVSRDGVVLASLAELEPSSAEGADPGVLTEALAEMGIDDPEAFDEDDHLDDLELLCRLTGVSPTVADVTGPTRAAIIVGG
jgi:uncharacterized protein DUF6461